MIYKNCTMETYTAVGMNDGIPCEVKINLGAIAVSYEDEDGLTLYEGSENGTGHYKLTCPKLKGKATLHCIADDDVLEGWWIEDGYEGMWRIHLDE